MFKESNANYSNALAKVGAENGLTSFLVFGPGIMGNPDTKDPIIDLVEHDEELIEAVSLKVETYSSIGVAKENEMGHKPADHRKAGDFSQTHSQHHFHLSSRIISNVPSPFERRPRHDSL